MARAARRRTAARCSRPREARGQAADRRAGRDAVVATAFDKDRRGRVGARPSREGREEQLRIENWMKLRPHLQGGDVATSERRYRCRAAGRRDQRRAGRAAAGQPGRQGMFGVQGTGDTSGFGGLVRRRPRSPTRPRPFGGYFDEVVRRARGGLPGLRRRDREGRRRPGRADPAHRAGADRRGLPDHAGRRGAALRAVLVGVRRGLPRLGRAPAARRLPPDLDDLPPPGPAGGRGHRRGPAPAERHQRLPDRRLAGAGDLRHVRHRLRRPPQPDPDPHAGRLGGPPAAQGLPARRRAGRVQGRRDPAAGPAEGPTSDAATRTTPASARPPRARSSPSPAATGTPSSAAPTRCTTSGSSSTWARSTRPRTACSGWCSSSRARRSPRPARSSATCTPASRRTSSTATGRRAPRS